MSRCACNFADYPSDKPDECAYHAQIRRELAAANTRIAELEKDKDTLKAWLVSSTNTVDALREALEWILPMARGYANEHPVGRNDEIVSHADLRLHNTRGRP